MNEANEAAKVAESLWQQLIHAPSHLLLLLVLFVVGMMWKASPLPNRWIPYTLLFLGAGGYPWIASSTNIDPSISHDKGVLALYGFLIGFGTIGLHILLKRSEKFCAFEDAIVNTFSKNSDPPKSPSPPVDYP